MSEVTLGTLYDLNRSAMKQQKPLDPISFNRKTEEMVKDIANRKAKFWMLLSNERRDYTLFIILTEDGTLKELRPTLRNRGQILSIDKQKDDNYEIWIRDPETKEDFVYYLFDYTFGVIKA